MNKSLHLGRASEYLVMSKLVNEGREVYCPAVDDHGVDLLVKTKSTENSYEYQEIQIKSLSTGGLFAAISCERPKANYWFVFYIKDINKMWLINSVDFANNLASKNEKGKNIGKYSLNLMNKKGPVAKCSAYIITDFENLP